MFGANVGLSGLVISPFPLCIALGSIIYARLIRRKLGGLKIRSADRSLTMEPEL